jgi:ferrochelatase
MMPGFSADCLETLEEISIEAREVFIEAGGVNFSTVPCLNDDKHHTNFLTNLIKERLLVGWL